MKGIDIITYICGSLGILLLLICCLISVFLLWDRCKHKRKRRRLRDGYALVENGIPSAAIARESLLKDNSDNLELKLGNGDVKSELKDEGKGITNIEFSIEDLEVPKPPTKKVKIVQFRQTKSEWDINDLKSTSEEEDERTSNVSAVRLSPLLRVSDEDKSAIKSQYFDALESIEEEDADSSPSEGEWIDVQEEKVKEEGTKCSTITGSKRHRCVKASSSSFKNNETVKRRIRALKKYQNEFCQIESEFYEELHKLEVGFATREDFLDVRDRRRTVIKKIPDYWTRCMENCDTLREIIKAYDIPVLSYLTDISVVPYCQNDRLGFLLEFSFSPNEYFTNSVLVKDYELRCGDGHRKGSDVGSEIVDCHGTKIFWNKGKNVTLRPVRRVSPDQNKFVIKWAKRNSFFNFFSPPRIDVLENKSASEEVKKKILLLEAHFEIGLFLKESFIPKSLMFYLYENGKSPEINSNSITTTYGKQTKVKQSFVEILKEKPHRSLPSAVKHVKMKEAEVPPNEEERSNFFSSDNFAKDTRNEIENSEKDIVNGTYRLKSSESFEEYMKSLGVGMIKRKIAHSVIPTVYVKIHDDGTYEVTTETPVKRKTSTFKIGKMFEEESLDGRMTKNIVSREDNTLTFRQEGINLSNHKNTIMVRKFERNQMTLKLFVDDVECTRIYERIS